MQTDRICILLTDNKSETDCIKNPINQLINRFLHPRLRFFLPFTVSLFWVRFVSSFYPLIPVHFCVEARVVSSSFPTRFLLKPSSLAAPCPPLLIAFSAPLSCPLPRSQYSFHPPTFLLNPLTFSFPVRVWNDVLGVLGAKLSSPDSFLLLGEPQLRLEPGSPRQMVRLMSCQGSDSVSEPQKRGFNNFDLN